MTEAAPAVFGSPKVQCARAFARQFPDELVHLEQVARLADMLFDATRDLHGMGRAERELLCCAALMHDVGISVSYAAHHKHSLRLILEADLPALTAEERLVAANIARYHRKAAPKRTHSAFADLGPDAQGLVRRLAAVLRVADGLDRAHENAVSEVQAAAQTASSWVLGIRGPGSLADAAQGALRKTGLFQDVYGVTLSFEPRGASA